jgi:hypothetical protein
VFIIANFCFSVIVTSFILMDAYIRRFSMLSELGPLADSDPCVIFGSTLFYYLCNYVYAP